MLIGVSALLTRTWEIYRAHWKTLSTYILAVFLPTFILFVVGAITVYVDIATTTFETATNIGMFVLVVALAVFSISNYVALISHIGSLVRDQEVAPWKQTLAATRKFFWPVVGVGIIVALIIFGGTLLLVIPGILFLVWYAFTPYVIILDGYSGLGSTLQKSKQLVAGRWFDVAIRLLVPAVLFALCSAFLKKGAVAVVLLLLPTSVLIDRSVGNLLGGLLQAFIAPLTMIAGIILYVSAKENPAPAPTETTIS